MMITDESQNWAEGYFTSRDGLRLYARHYPACVRSTARPVLCLPGLSRNSKDFHVLATCLSQQGTPGRDVYCLDFRGRGKSERDKDWSNYTPPVELMDTLDFMTITGLHETAIIGTSRSGIIAMLMALARPTAIGVCILNDIGPVLETGGLARIIGYVGKTPVPSDWDEAALIAQRMNQQFFTDTSNEEWKAVSRQWFAEKDGHPALDYDEKLAVTMEQMDMTRKLPEMWPQFRALAHAPTLVIRGENSDLLSEKTVSRMAENHPRLSNWAVRDQGHAPFLRDRPTIDRISQFLTDTD